MVTSGGATLFSVGVVQTFVTGLTKAFGVVIPILLAVASTVYG